jgi:hypothetical protein
MPTLLELQNAIQRSLVHRENHTVSAMLAAHVSQDRLDIYRNTFLQSLTKVLRLCFPVVQRLVGEEFFEGTVQVFIAEHPPKAAWLEQYGGEFPGFLRTFPPATSIAYLGDIAELEWAVNGALHAPDTESLDIGRLGAIEADDQGRIRFVANPSLRLLRLGQPVDDIWHAILESDDEALRRINLGDGPIHLLIERRATGVEVVRLDETAWRFLSELCSGEAIEVAVERAVDFDCANALAEHLALGRFSGFEVPDDSLTSTAA